MRRDFILVGVVVVVGWSVRGCDKHLTSRWQEVTKCMCRVLGMQAGLAYTWNVRKGCSNCPVVRFVAMNATIESDRFVVSAHRSMCNDGASRLYLDSFEGRGYSLFRKNWLGLKLQHVEPRVMGPWNPFPFYPLLPFHRHRDLMNPRVEAPLAFDSLASL